MKLLKRLCRYILREELKHKDEVIDRLYTTVQERKEVAVYRLNPEVFKSLKKSLQESVITSTTTDLQAAALVGQQRVLDVIEKGIVSG